MPEPPQPTPCPADLGPPERRHGVAVFIVEDETAVREHLAQLVHTDPRLRLAGSAASHAQALRWLVDSRHRLDVLLVDLGLPDRSGLEVIAQCRQLRPEVAIMVLTLFGDERHVFAALQAGATGYLLKSSAQATLVDLIVELHAGGAPITPTVASLVLRRLHQTQASAAPEAADAPAPADTVALSAREAHVLNLVAVGYASSEIAQQLHLSTHTVNTHIRRIYHKLEVHSRSAAVYEAGRRGLLHGP